MKKIFFCILILTAFTLPAFADVGQGRINAAQAMLSKELVIEAPLAVSGQEFGYFDITYFGADGKIKDREIAFNTLANDGQQHVLDVYLRNASGVTNFYLGLTDSTSTCSIAKADTLATVVGYGEPSSGGYARSLIERSNTGWPTLALDSGDYMATSSTETFTATTGFGPVYCAFITDASSGTTGKHISWAALSTGRTLAASETLQATYKIKFQ